MSEIAELYAYTRIQLYGREERDDQIIVKPMQAVLDRASHPACRSYPRPHGGERAQDGASERTCPPAFIGEQRFGAMTLHKRWIDTTPRVREADRPTVRMPLSYFTKIGSSPSSDSYLPEFKAFFCCNPHHPLNGPSFTRDLTAR